MMVGGSRRYNITWTPFFFISTSKLIKLQPFWCIIFIKISLEEGWRWIILFFGLIGPSPVSLIHFFEGVGSDQSYKQYCQSGQSALSGHDMSAHLTLIQESTLRN